MNVIRTGLAIAAKVKTFLTKRPFHFQHMIPARQSMFFNLNVKVTEYPTTVIYSPEGKLRKKFDDALKPGQLALVRRLIDDFLEGS